MGKITLICLVFVAGAVMPVQVAMNTRLDKAVASPVVAAMVSFLGGVLLLIAMWSVGLLGRGHPGAIIEAPWWAYLTGPLGVFIVISGLVALPRASAAVLIASIVFGEGAASLLIDHYGWLDVKRVAINGWRVGGLILIFIGVLFMQKQK